MFVNLCVLALKMKYALYFLLVYMGKWEELEMRSFCCLFLSFQKKIKLTL